MIIYHNISAMNSQRVLGINNNQMNGNMEKMSSGLRINRAGDDAAGLSVSEKMRAQIRGLAQGSRNSQDGISLIQTTEGWLQEAGNIVQRIRELSIQAANGIYTKEDRGYIQMEVEQLEAEVLRIHDHAEFNQKRLFDGTLSAESGEVGKASPGQAAPAATPPSSTEGTPIHVGANTDQRIFVKVDKMNPTELGIKEIKVDTAANAEVAIQKSDIALQKINSQRAYLGAAQNRLESTIRGTDIAHENLQAAESRIRDTDMAKEMVNFVRNQILSQANASMLTQANLRPQLVLRVLG